ncbi:MAG: AsmA-like C-terminal region-containing protein [Winogradskyella sp.]|nr:AsmA-like C-terminal region-containing protein [Winogradskyella sp.]
MKKLLKILGVILIIFVLLLALVPLLLESKIDTIVQRYADNNLNAKVKFDDVSLSLLSSFPKASMSIENLEIRTLHPFEDELLATSKLISFEMPIMELFKDTQDEPINITEILAEETLLTLVSNLDGKVNYDILKPTDTTNSDGSSTSAFQFNIENYEIKNSALSYTDQAENLTFSLTQINHSGTGLFTSDLNELITHTDAKIGLAMDSTQYLNNNSILLDATIEIDFENEKYTFKDNKGYINALPLEFYGYVQLVEEGQQMDLTFKNPESSFKDFLAIIPEAYAADLNDIETTGNFTLNGMVKGLYSEKTIPQLDIKLSSNNASFKFSSLPKRVENIMINAAVQNETGILDDTYITINNFDFKIDDNSFKSSASIKNLTKEVLVNAAIDGVLNLAHIKDVYPIQLKNQLSGIITTKLNTNFDMNAIEQNAYQRIKSVGTLNVKDVVFSSEDIVNPIQINTADVTFKPGLTTVQSFNAISGTSDIKATGTVKNLLGFLLSDKNLIGNFNVNSNRFRLSDFMVSEVETNDNTTSDKTALKIPQFLDCTINATVKEVVYDNLNLKNVVGQLEIKDQGATLNKVTSNIFDGVLEVSGKISTANDIPDFNLNLGMSQFDISQSFTDLQFLKSIAPIAKVLQGKLNSVIELKGQLNDEFTPNLQSISGNAFAELLTSKIDASKSPILAELDNKINFIDLDRLDLKNLKSNLSFSNGQVLVKPFNLKYNDINIEISGTHSFENNLDYNAVFNVPAKYLGGEVNSLLKRINNSEVNNISIPVTASIGGTFSSPNISTDLTSGVSSLTKQLIEIEKQKLIDKGSDKVSDLLGGLLGGTSQNTTKQDSTKIDSTSNTNKTKVKEGVKSILGGILNKKKKTTTETSKDSTKN